MYRRLMPLRFHVDRAVCMRNRLSVLIWAAALSIPYMSNGKNKLEQQAVVNYLEIYGLKRAMHCQHGKLPLINLTPTCCSWKVNAKLSRIPWYRKCSFLMSMIVNLTLDQLSSPQRAKLKISVKLGHKTLL